ncbi:MAG: HAD family hydrolase [Patescibacteria group bacterium]
MIKGIILDVDGVIVGEKIGYNSPYPHPEVIARLKDIESRGIKVSLCTAKPHYAIRRIIEDAKLHNLHITDGGAVIIDPLDNVILKAHFINQDVATEVIELYLEHGVYTEVYTANEYLIQKNQTSELTQLHTHILQTKPLVVESLIEESRKLDIVKIMPIAKHETDKARLTELFPSFSNELTLSWGVHPVALPHQFGIITAKGISKKQAALEIAEHSQISPEELLGIGDSTSDWQFIGQCGYAGTVSNSSEELKRLISTRKNSYIGDSVDVNGVLNIFDHFSI